MTIIHGNSFILPHKQPPSRTQLKKQLYKVLFARSDITAAKESCELFIEKVDNIVHPLYYPLYASIVVCYVRPFTNNKPLGSLPKRYSNFTDETLKSVHEELLKARHELIAHSDLSNRTAFIVPPNVVIGGDGKNSLRFSNIGTAVNIQFIPLKKFADILCLINHQLKHIKSEIESLLSSLYTEMELPNDKFKLRINDGL